MRAEVTELPAAMPLAIHASAVAIGRRCLLIRGASRAGKSRLATALVAASSRARPVRLVGDDRILLSETARGVVARPHPRIAGFIERRGLGIVAMPFLAEAPVAALVELGPTTIRPAVLDNFPILSFVDEDNEERCARVLRWWTVTLSATSRPHVPRNAVSAARASRKD